MKKFLIVVSLFIFCSTAFANQMNTGCGMGTWLLNRNDDTTLMQLLITTTNNSTGSQSTGITTGIESWGCSATRNWATNDVQEFVEGNMDSIMRDVAAGHGASIETLGALMNIADTAALGSKLQQNFAIIFPSVDVEFAYVADAIYIVSNS